MAFKGRLLTEIGRDVDSSNNYAQQTDSILRFYSLVSNLEVEFKAFLTDLSDNFQSSWNSEQVYGRMDPMGSFQNTKRVITVGWDIPAASLEEAQSNMEAIRSLTSMLYPTYSANPITVEGEASFTTANSISSSPLVRVKFANLISKGEGRTAKDSGLLGWIDGVNIQPQIEQGFIIKNNKHYPKLYKMSITLNVLHEHDLGWSTTQVTEVEEDEYGESETTFSRTAWLGSVANKKWPFGG